MGVGAERFTMTITGQKISGKLYCSQGTEGDLHHNIIIVKISNLFIFLINIYKNWINRKLCSFRIIRCILIILEIALFFIEIFLYMGKFFMNNTDLAVIEQDPQE